jgi:hypothetical protein
MFVWWVFSILPNSVILGVLAIKTKSMGYPDVEKHVAESGHVPGASKTTVRPWYVPIVVHAYHKIRGVSFLTQF